MKKIEALVHSDKTTAVVHALSKEGIGGMTVIPGRGQGAAPRAEVSTGRGTSRVTAMYNAIDTVVTVVDDSKVDSVINAITGAASTGSKGDGKIFVSAIEDAVDISNKEKGSQAL